MHSNLTFVELVGATERRKKAQVCPKTGTTWRRHDLEEERRRPPAGG
ncbi:hypothetical protein EV648_103400 [Kribbella sp. VKM Ac-2568]|nr:hypothetical protein EV648_103400 [Kribbella sp. VKM Ac-2568]